MTEARDSEYTMGSTEEFLQLLARRNVETRASHLRPLLSSGMAMLDVGFTDGLDAFEQLLDANSGHPEKGRELKADFIDAGLQDVVASPSIEQFAEPDDVRWFASFAQAFLNTPAYAEAMEKTGIADAARRAARNAALEGWTSDPAGYFAMAWGEAVGRVPAS